MKHRGLIYSVALTIVIAFGAPTFAADDALLCQTNKLKRAGKYSFCRLKAESKAVKKGEAPDYSKCDLQFNEKWTEAEGNANGACPTNGDAVAILGSLATDADILAAKIAGDPIPDPAYPASGQLTCWNVAGAVIPCAGTGQDGEQQAGSTLSYIDNGDGTITDLNTGLMWERLTDDGTIHDKDNIYTFTEASTVHLANLNSNTFAGFTDWRVPNIKELQSLVNFETHGGAVSVAFLNGCVFNCVTCSCTVGSLYWSATTSHGLTTYGWGVDFDNGFTSRTVKTNKYYVRAVRGGL